MVVDALFCDNIYNVWLNIKEMLRYNSKLDAEDKVLDNDKIDFYQMILNFDKISCEDKINLFNKLYDKNISVSFYDDLRKLKDISYDMIKKDLIDLSKCDDKLVSNDIDDVKVYDLRDKSNKEQKMFIDEIRERLSKQVMNVNAGEVVELHVSCLNDDNS